MAHELRPCLIEKSGEKALFHRWAEVSEIVPPAIAVGGHNGGVVKDVMALIELENGRVGMIRASAIRFLDSEKKFIQFNFGERGDGEQ